MEFKTNPIHKSDCIKGGFEQFADLRVRLAKNGGSVFDGGRVVKTLMYTVVVVELPPILRVGKISITGPEN